MEAVASHAVPFGQVGVDRVRVRRRCERLVERGVEDGDMRNVGERLLGSPDPFEVRRVVQRREVGEVFDVELDERRDDGGFEESLAAVHDAVADGDRGVGVECRPVLGEGVEHGAETCRVIRDLERALARP